MPRSPFAYLHFAVMGLLVGLGIATGSGIRLQDQWRHGGEKAVSDYVAVQGRITKAQWRRSAAPDGPNWYLQVWVEGDDRGFLIAERDLSTSSLETVGVSEARDAPISELVGREGVVYLDSALVDSSTPYLSALQIEGRFVGPSKQAAVSMFSSSSQWGVALFWGAGMLLGVGLLGVSVHHLVVCLRYWRRNP